jgi:hypothetical protein
MIKLKISIKIIEKNQKIIKNLGGKNRIQKVRKTIMLKIIKKGEKINILINMMIRKKFIIMIKISKIQNYLHTNMNSNQNRARTQSLIQSKDLFQA